MPTEWTREDVLAASDDWVWVPPGAERLAVEGVNVIDYPDWAQLGCYVMPVEVAGPPRRLIAAVQAAAVERGHDASSWWITPTTTPSESLVQALVDGGAELVDSADIMAFDFTQELPSTGVTPEVTTHLVLDEVTLDEAEIVSTQVWGGDPSSGDRRAQQLARLDDGWGDEGGFRVVARLAGRPIATGGCQVVGEVARLWGACCLPDARGRGGYRAVLRARLELARTRGATLALVQARVGTSQPILLRLGFQAYGRGHRYRLPVDEVAVPTR